MTFKFTLSNSDYLELVRILIRVSVVILNMHMLLL